MSERGTPLHATASRRDPRTLALNIVIGLLVVVVGYLSYSLINRHVLQPPVDAGKAGVAPGEIIQIDVLNGSGLQGAANTCTGYLRARGFDVVEMRNYKTSDVDETLVIDRVGSMANAEKVAYALGVKKKNIVQQLNHDYYVDVSVVIGKDYSSLKPSH
ncbi:MAG: LytR C-terminal domain-containing protein [Bacteroidota bacterium]